MIIHFDEKILQIPEDFIKKNKSILEFLHDKESIKLHDNYIEFKNFTGIFVVNENEKYLIIPKKLVKKFNLLGEDEKPKENAFKTYLEKFNLFLKYILNELSKEKILFTLNLAKFPIDEGKTNSSKIFKLLLLLQFKETLINSLHLILSNPHRELTEKEVYKRLDEVSYIDETIILDMITNQNNLYKVDNGIIQDRYSPIEVLQYEAEETFDTLENRFIKSFLKEIEFTIKEDLKEFLDINDLVEIRNEIEYCLQSSIFNEVGDLNNFPSNSQVLIKKAGYRELFQIYRYFHISFIPKFAEDLDLAFSLKDMATLWEYYVLIKLLKILKKEFGNYKIKEDFKERKKGKTIYETATFEFEEGLVLYFQPTKRTYSNLEFRPDFLIEYKDERFVFDAKFRIFEDNKQDILKNMHYYKDGLKAKFSIAICVGNEENGKFYFRKSEKTEEEKINFDMIYNFIKNGKYSGIGYVNLNLEESTV